MADDPSDGATQSDGWPGFDPNISLELKASGQQSQGAQLTRELTDRISAARGLRYRIGLPIAVRSTAARELSRFAEAVHRMLERIVVLHSHDDEISRVLAVPADMSEDVCLDRLPSNARIHLCRLDLVTTAGGDFRALEANANCPAALVYSGWASAAWRAALSSTLTIPPALDHEKATWFAEWFVQAANATTGSTPGSVALLRVSGGNRTELADLERQFHELGIEAFEADPRDVSFGSSGVTVLGRPVRHAYLKLGMQDFRHLRAELDDFVSAVRSGALFVQNGQRGRWLGDNKLCLAVLSDPAFQDRFDVADWDLVHPRIPWSRSLALCSQESVGLVRSQRQNYVLKHPLDTRGRGVVIGREVADSQAWMGAVETARAQNWLVQEFCAGTHITNGEDRPPYLHDLALGVVNGKIVGAFTRSSPGLKTNIALGGRLHPVFL
ncbi:MAG: hypothetical protein KJO18_04850 [Acidimicrobiia bacterium]|nr:hypothetical protein [Acidimicrobiia bacterium]